MVAVMVTVAVAVTKWFPTINRCFQPMTVRLPRSSWRLKTSKLRKMMRKGWSSRLKDGCRFHGNEPMSWDWDSCSSRDNSCDNSWESESESPEILWHCHSDSQNAMKKSAIGNGTLDFATSLEVAAVVSKLKQWAGYSCLQILQTSHSPWCSSYIPNWMNIYINIRPNVVLCHPRSMSIYIER